MNRQAVLLASLASAVGLGLVLLTRREEGAFPTVEEISPERWREDLYQQFLATERKLEDTKEAVEDALHVTEARAAQTVESGLGLVRKTVSATLGTALWLGVLGAFVVYIYAPERRQQEKLWQTTKVVLDSTRAAVLSSYHLGEQVWNAIT